MITKTGPVQEIMPWKCIQNAIGDRKTVAFSGFHRFMGCDTTGKSKFAVKRKTSYGKFVLNHMTVHVFYMHSLNWVQLKIHIQGVMSSF